MSLVPYAATPVAAASVIFTAGVPSYARQRGFSAAAIVDTGVGDVTVTLAEAYDFTAGQAIAIATVQGNILAAIAIEPVGAAPQTQLRCRIASLTVAPAITAADLAFSLAVHILGNP